MYKKILSAYNRADIKPKIFEFWTLEVCNLKFHVKHAIVRGKCEKSS